MERLIETPYGGVCVREDGSIEGDPQAVAHYHEVVVPAEAALAENAKETYRYICRKDDPLIVKASGFVGKGGLGAFDKAIYKEVVGSLPEGHSFEHPPAVFGEATFG